MRGSRERSVSAVALERGWLVKEHSVATVIAVDPDHLLSFVADLTNDVRWRHDLAMSELVSGHAGERGSDYRQMGVTPGRDDPYLIELVDVDRSSRSATFATVDRSPVAFGVVTESSTLAAAQRSR